MKRSDWTFDRQYETEEDLLAGGAAVKREIELRRRARESFVSSVIQSFRAFDSVPEGSLGIEHVSHFVHLARDADQHPEGFPVSALCHLLARECRPDGERASRGQLMRLLRDAIERLESETYVHHPELADVLTAYKAWQDGPTSSHSKFLTKPLTAFPYILLHRRAPLNRLLNALTPNPSLSPRPTTAGRLARAVRWFMLHRTGKPSRLRGRG